MAVTAPEIPELCRKTPVTGISDPSWEAILGPVQTFLARVSQHLEAQVSQFEPEIAEHARYALDNRGKQLRPALVGLCASAVGRIRNDHVTARWGNHLAVLLGDCLFAHAMKMASTLSAQDVFRALAQATSAVCTGEILQSNRRRRWDLPRSEYLRMVEMKTAELFAVASELGARHGGGNSTEISAVREFALAAGTAYQIYDDCLDLYGSERAAGKSLGTDLATGKLTLPLIVLLERATPADAAEIRGWLNAWNPEFLVGLQGLLEAHGAFAESSAVIEGLLQRARRALEVLPDTPEREALNVFTYFIARQTSLLAR